jgi:alpha-1,2-mannosyltransferase
VLTTPATGEIDARRSRLRTAALVALVTTLVVSIPGRRGWFDIGVYHDAVVYWIHRPGHLYDFVRPGTPYGFTYPPFAALCMLPMALLDWHATIAVNLVISLAALGFLTHRLVDPVARERGWPRWRTYAVVACLLALYEPVRDTISYGQINLVLVALVYADLALLEGRWGRWAGVGTGVAAAIKLTPAIFILYFLLTGRRRAAAISGAAMLAATALTGLLAPTATATYFVKAVWDTKRVGALPYVSNQSLMGLVARLGPAGVPNQLLWLGCVAVVLASWAWIVRRTGGDLRGGFAATGVAACLVSPVTWLHHLVWLLPALVAFAADPRRRWATVAAYLATGSGIVWLWWKDHSGAVFLVGSNLGVFASLMLLWWPPRRPSPVPEAVVDEPLRPAHAHETAPPR